MNLLLGGGKDYVVVGSDSGRICILEYNAAKNSFERVHIETFGKSGCRRKINRQTKLWIREGNCFLIGV